MSPTTPEHERGTWDELLEALDRPHSGAVSWLVAPASDPHGPSQVFWAGFPEPVLPGCPDSSVARLISGIYAAEPRMARKWVRGRIFTTQKSLTSLCRGIVKVAAKRITRVVPSPSSPEIEALMELRGRALVRKLPATPRTGGADPAALEFPADDILHSPDEVIAELRRLRQEHVRAGASGPQHRYERDRDVIALLVDREGRVLARARNTNATERTRHAEMNLVQGWWEHHRRPLPAGCTLWVTLKPCRMCAGAIWEAARNPHDATRDLRVRYLEDDPGPNARLTVLEAGSPERLQAVQDARLPHEWTHCEIQVPLLQPVLC